MHVDKKNSGIVNQVQYFNSQITDDKTYQICVEIVYLHMLFHTTSIHYLDESSFMPIRRLNMVGEEKNLYK